MEKAIDRRTVLQAGLAVALGTGVAAGTRTGEAVAAVGGPPLLRDKFFGCLAGVYVGSAMGAAVEGWAWERVEQEYGTLDRLLPYHHYQAPGLISEPFEGALLEMARTPMPAADIGKYCDYSGLVSLARSCHPIGLINAGDVPSAIADVHEVGQLYNVAGNRSLRWAEVTVAAIAAATRSIPEDRLAQVDRATALNPHTCVRKTVRETADGLFEAYRARLARLRTFVDAMSGA